jgi:uncharacterized protein YunC (DUF1805 family)
MRDGDDWHDTAFLTVEKNRGNVMCGFLLRAFASSFIVALGIDAAECLPANRQIEAMSVESDSIGQRGGRLRKPNTC